MKKIVYVTSSDFKTEENKVFCEEYVLSDGSKVRDLFAFEIRREPIHERLEVDIAKLVQAEVVEAYRRVKVPCIVEHAGLIFDEYRDHSYPGGLTKPMWNALGDRFIEETHSAGRGVTARAVVAYCDGAQIRTFIGETHGTVSARPRGKREFYWDTIIEPDDPTGSVTGKTYAEIVEEFGLAFKVTQLSQSSRAMAQFLEYLRLDPPTLLWG